MKPTLVETLRRVRDLEVARAEEALAEAEERREQASEAVMSANSALQEFDDAWSEMIARGVSPQKMRLADDERRRHVDAVSGARAELVRNAERVSRCNAAVIKARMESKQHAKVEERLAAQSRKEELRSEQKMLDAIGSRFQGDE